MNRKQRKLRDRLAYKASRTEDEMYIGMELWNACKKEMKPLVECLEELVALVEDSNTRSKLDSFSAQPGRLALRKFKGLADMDECKGIELLDGSYTGCTEIYGDCPVCGR